MRSWSPGGRGSNYVVYVSGVQCRVKKLPARVSEEPMQLHLLTSKCVLNLKRCLSGSVCAGESRDDAGLDRTLLIVARATSAELESRVYVLVLAQETSEKNIG